MSNRDDEDKLNEAIARSDRAKKQVADINLRLGNINARDSYGRRLDKFTRERLKHDLKAQLNDAMMELFAAKSDLRKLSGTTGHDPKWLIIVKAYRVISSLDEQGIDIGEMGRGLLDDIEFHVPMSKLVEESDAKE